MRRPTRHPSTTSKPHRVVRVPVVRLSLISEQLQGCCDLFGVKAHWCGSTPTRRSLIVANLRSPEEIGRKILKPHLSALTRFIFCAAICGPSPLFGFHDITFRQQRAQRQIRV